MPNYQEKPRRAEIVKTQPLYGKGKTKDGSRPHIGTRIVDSDGVTKVLLTPAGRTAKAAEELRRGQHLTNSGEVKTDKRGNVMQLTQSEAAYRMGQLAQAKASAKCHNATQAKASGKRK